MNKLKAILALIALLLIPSLAFAAVSISRSNNGLNATVVSGDATAGDVLFGTGAGTAGWDATPAIDCTDCTNIPAPGAPGADTQVIFNDGGSLGADAGLTYDKAADDLTVVGDVGAATGTFSGAVTAGSFSAPGSDTQLLFNDGGVNGASSSGTFDKTTGTLSVQALQDVDGPGTNWSIATNGDIDGSAFTGDTFTATTLTFHTIPIDLSTVIVDASICTKATRAINSAPTINVINCTDAASDGTISFAVYLPESFDTTGVVRVIGYAESEEGTPSGVMDIDWQVRCVGQSGLIDSTLGTAASQTFGTFDTQYDARYAQSGDLDTASAGSCSAGEHMFVQGTWDQSETTTPNNNANSYIISLAINYATHVGL